MTALPRRRTKLKMLRLSQASAKEVISAVVASQQGMLLFFTAALNAKSECVFIHSFNHKAIKGLERLGHKPCRSARHT